MKRLSPPGESLVPGPLRRVSPDDSQDYPTIRMAYGVDVPVIHDSAAIRRVLALCYLLIWAWREHRLAAELRHEDPAQTIVFLIDEGRGAPAPEVAAPDPPMFVRGCEGPERQRTRTGCAGDRVDSFSSGLCSLEPIFDESMDRILDMDLDNASVKIETVAFSKLGTGENWLLSRNFDLSSTYSEPAEKAIGEAGALIREDLKSPGAATQAAYLKLDRRLRDELPDDDSFWVPLAEGRRKEGLAEVIPVRTRPEPPNFHRRVREPGEGILRNHQPVAPVPFRFWKKRDYWFHAKDDLFRAYGGVCAYTGMGIDNVTGAKSVDHFHPKTHYPELAYEWSNLRLACGRMNSRKGDSVGILDPFRIRRQLFSLNPITGELIVHHDCPRRLRAAAQTTLDLFGLNDALCSSSLQQQGLYP
jgi:5-methylcytosine-specific restriction endonuclease McrA